mmetsp:Transcript_9078/g.17112  ORF Transcript_9078/g.17112 Transcript_9078/m.17112 type:complete len:337 (-) Transcript_9078:30-1040(-)
MNPTSLQSTSSSPNVSSLPQITSVPCKDGYIQVPRSYVNSSGKEVKKKYSLSYRVFRPKAILSTTHHPVIVIHGGLGLPCDYLLPIVDIMPYRCVIMYDQLGCGRSESPPDIQAYSIESSVQDLQHLLDELGVGPFHLFAHSAGTCIAYEYLKKKCRGPQLHHESSQVEVAVDSPSTCLSAVFSSGSYHIQLARGLTSIMERNIKHEMLLEHGAVDPSQVAEIIRTQCMCRTPSTPIQLKTAYSKAGKIWKGLDVIRDYVAQSPSLSGVLPPLLLLRGEFDFITAELVFQGWKNVFCNNQQEIEFVTLKGCSHMPMLEDPTSLGRELDAFYKKYDQ